MRLGVVHFPQLAVRIGERLEGWIPADLLVIEALANVELIIGRQCLIARIAQERLEISHAP